MIDQSPAFEAAITKEQLYNVFQQMPKRAVKHRISLTVLTMSKSELIESCRENLDTTSELLTMASGHLSDTKAQLETAEAAFSRVAVVTEYLLKEIGELEAD